MLDITTFDARAGGNVLYKALAHPLAAEALERLCARLAPPVALVDPDNIAAALLALAPAMPAIEGRYVQDVMAIGQTVAGLPGRPLTALPRAAAGSVLIAAFDAGRIAARLQPFAPKGATIATLDAARLPDAMLTNPRR
ncbi:MAG: hypothetical protein J0I21_02505, partial [Alphaproteobacteria bacterium]|nr:hypothetical protein [Alphaproteobacteria bacterium]